MKDISYHPFAEEKLESREACVASRRICNFTELQNSRRCIRRGNNPA